uniref:RNA-dependent RNA polymerase n=1 Tax=Opuntia streptacantha TaxID=393608 RepID=A0A7C9APP8_OPUST
MFSNLRGALRVALVHGDMDDDFTVARMLLSGIPLEEPYIQWRLHVLANEEKKSLKEGKLPIKESFYLMGTADPIDCLEEDEVCIIHENGQISGDVLVYRNPGIHFGDIRPLKATHKKSLEDIVGNSKYGIFFSTKGPRSLADQMAGGDYDGDMYWISRNPEVSS